MAFKCFLGPHVQQSGTNYAILVARALWGKFMCNYFKFEKNGSGEDVIYGRTTDEERSQ